MVEGFANELVVYDGLVAPGIFVPFRLHWYEGERPPFTGLAVYVTEVPVKEQIDVDDVVIVTDGISVGFTISVLLADIVLHEPPDVVKDSVTVAGAVAEAV
jgi:hypothetical protein